MPTWPPPYSRRTTKSIPSATTSTPSCWRSCRIRLKWSLPPSTLCLWRVIWSASPTTPPTSLRTSSSWCAASTCATTPPKKNSDQVLLGRVSGGGLRPGYLGRDHPLQHASRRPQPGLSGDSYQRTLFQIHHQRRFQQQADQAPQVRLVARDQD